MADDKKLIAFEGKKGSDRISAPELLKTLMTDGFEVDITQIDTVIVVLHAKDGAMTTLTNAGATSKTLWIMEHAKLQMLASDLD